VYFIMKKSEVGVCFIIKESECVFYLERELSVYVKDMMIMCTLMCIKQM
jgi:hypothetical protein